MKGYNEFLSMFGNITVLQIAEFVIACVFLYFVYKKVRDYLIKKHETEQLKNEQLEEALSAVRKYPEYRQQSIDIQKSLEGEIQGLKQMQEEISVKLVQMEETSKRRERNKLRDRLLQNYRYYTNMETNPSQSWSRMESDAFWELFRDYEDAGGNGYVHTEVLPAMQKLKIVEHDV